MKEKRFKNAQFLQCDFSVQSSLFSSVIFSVDDSKPEDIDVQFSDASSID
eukprot:CAMPEP_0194174190 /NCGR_PEP_ID=MMETSP0154-20130528/8444_1 /TAXON_ID=1049557 /ORGANISM="Thalassiothrix antarctica, Strain L6-D1" /LENGTH=49 /DNA_ID= /DNA_START= /DNA_END= /DNA_ORIENTATION=